MEASKVTKNSTLKINTYAIPDNKYAEDLIRMRLALNDTSYTLVDDEGKLKRFKITLTKTTTPEAKNTKKSLEEKINELDSKQRKKLAKLIDSL